MAITIHQRPTFRLKLHRKQLTAAAPPRTPLGELTALPRHPRLGGPISKGKGSEGMKCKERDGRGGKGRGSGTPLFWEKVTLLMILAILTHKKEAPGDIRPTTLTHIPHSLLFQRRPWWWRPQRRLRGNKRSLSWRRARAASVCPGSTCSSRAGEIPRTDPSPTGRTHVTWARHFKSNVRSTSPSARCRRTLSLWHLRCV